ncbi:MAG: hypothetical protein WAQ99_02455 [Pyrinomonadaceae bacterium]
MNITQLAPVDGVIPVSLQCQTKDYPKPVEGKALNCVVRNNTITPVTAISLRYSLQYLLGSKELETNGSITMDALIHRDFHASNFTKFILPAGERAFGREALVQDGMTNVELSISVDYVEFDDGAWLGPNSNGSREVKDIRDGASKYRAWLRKNYLKRGKSQAAIKTLVMQSTSNLSDLQLNEKLITGAEAYRKNAQEVINFRGGVSQLQHQLSIERIPEPNR